MDHLKCLLEKYLESTLTFKKTHCKELIPITELNGVISLCRLYDSMTTDSSGVSPVLPLLSGNQIRRIFHPSPPPSVRRITRTRKSREGWWNCALSSALSGPSVPPWTRTDGGRWTNSCERWRVPSLSRSVYRAKGHQLNQSRTVYFAKLKA